MPRVHSHAGREAPQCPLSKSECDDNWTAYLHGHLGKPCVKAVQESKTRKGQPNSRATCTLVVPPGGRSFQGEVAHQLAATGGVEPPFPG